LLLFISAQLQNAHLSLFAVDLINCPVVVPAR
jgi:hypothetical protein